MTREDIDKALEAMAAEAEATGDPSKGPGAICIGPEEWIALASSLPFHVPTDKLGIRYRGVRVRVRHDTCGFQNRAEAEADGVLDFFDLEASDAT